LTLDEFAMWLHLDDVYWEREGRASIDAVVLFGALVSVGLWSGPFLRAVVRQMARVAKRKREHHHAHPESVHGAPPRSAAPGRGSPAKDP
jgi:hypothetical protein